MDMCEAPTTEPQPIRALQGLLAEQMRLFMPMCTHKSYKKQQQNHSHNIDRGKEREEGKVIFCLQKKGGGYYN